MKKILTMLVISLLVLSMMLVAPLTHATEATIWTDKANYAPDETVTIFGSNFADNTQITITITAPDSSVATIYALTDASGAFTAQHKLNGIEGIYTVTATDGTNTDSTTFTEAKPTFTITIDKINGYSSPFPTLTNPIHLEGSASSTNFPGQISAYQVQVNWGDGTVDPDSTVNFVVSPNGKDFSGTWSSNPDHNYAASGTYNITVKLYHQQPPGAEAGDAQAQVTLTIILQYYLTVVSAYSTTSGEGWYNESDTAYADVTDSIVEIVPGLVRAVFTGWSGDASGTGLVSDPITMDGAKTAVANWKIQYYLDVVTDPSDLPSIPGADWYDNCTWVELTAPTYLPDEAGVDGVRYKFSYWDVDETPVEGNPIDIHVNASHTATAYYTAQYYLTLTTSPPSVNTPTGEGWYDGGTDASISTDQYVPISSRYRFDGWTTDDMSEIANSSSPSTTVLMDKAKTVTANYVIQYYLTVKTDPEDLVIISGEDWYDNCTWVELTAPSVTGYLFTYWDVDETPIEGNPIEVHMNASHTATAHYGPEIQHDVAITNVIASPSEVLTGGSVTINVTAENLGNVRENFTVTAYYDSNEVGTQSVNDLDPSTSTILTFDWDTTGVSLGTYTISANASTVPSETNTTNNGFIDGTVEIVKHPIAYFEYTPALPKENDTVTFNASGSTPDGGTIEWYYWDFNDTETDNVTDPATTHVFAKLGNYSVTLTIGDSEGQTDTTWQLVTVMSAVKHDISILNVTISTPHEYPGRIVNITVVVKNNGEIAETFNITIYRNSTEIGKIRVTNLGVGENTTKIFNWNTSGLTPCQNWTIRAEAPIVGDVNPDDNTFTDGTVKIKMIGDVNVDGIVNIYDMRVVAKAYTARPGSPNWNPQADLYQDGKINIHDLVVVGRNYGKRCP